MISRKEIEHLARLARIALTETEKAKFEKELPGILDFVAKLNAVDTSNVEPLTGGTELVNVMREDKAGGQKIGDSGQDLVQAAPKHRDGFVEVKAVFERE